MPNDPRVKFRAPGKVCDKDIDYLRKHPEYLKDHPECRVVFAQHYSGGGGSGRLRSIFEDGTPPPDRPTEQPGGGTGGGGATDIVPASLPIKPGLDPGGIAGITIASAIAMGAAAALAEHERRQRMNRGIPVPTDDTTTRRSRPNLNRGGTRVPRAISRAMTNIPQAVEMTSTSRPVQADFAPISVESSPSSSGTSTPSAQSARSSAGSSSDFQSARSRPSSTTPAPAVDPTYSGRVTQKGIDRWGRLPMEVGERPLSVLIRDPLHSSISAALDNDPNRLSTIFTSETGTIGEIRPSAVPASGAAIRKPDTPLNLQNELEKRQLELQDPNVSEGRTKTLQREIRVLEREIISSGGTVSTIEDRIRGAMDTTMARPPAPAPASAPAPAQPADIQSARSRPSATTRDALPPPPQSTSTNTRRRNIFQSTRVEPTPQKIEMSSTMTPARYNEYRNRIEGVPSRPAPAPAPALAPTPVIDDIRAAIQTSLPTEVNRPSAPAAAIEQIRAAIGTDLPKSGIFSIRNEPTQTAEDVRLERVNMGIRGEIRELETKIASAGIELQDTSIMQEQLDNLRINLELNNITRENIMLQKSLDIIPGRPKGTNKELLKRRLVLIDEKLRGNLSASVRQGFNVTRERVNNLLTMGGTTPESGRATMERISTSGQATMPRSETRIPRGETEMTGSTLSARGASEALSARAAPPPPPPPAPSVEPLEEPSRPPAERPLPAEQRQEIEPTASRPPPTEAPPQLEPTPAPIEQPVPVERPPPTNVREIPPEIQDFLKLYNKVIEVHTAAGRVIPEVPEKYINTLPEGEIELRTRGYIINKILKESPDLVITGETGTKFEGTKITPEELRQELLDRFKEAKAAAKFDEANIDSKIASQEGSHTTETQKIIDKRKGKLTKKTGLLATEEQRLRPTPLAGEAQARVQVRQTAPVESRAAAPEMRSAPETMAAAPEVSARSVPAPAVAAPEVTARRRMGVPELTAPPPAAPTETASFEERRAFFEETSKIKPPPGEPAPSAPPSAPESGAATPSERPTMEQTPAERAAFAEELTGRLKKGPARQKAKINIGKPKTTANPLDIFVSPQHRNLPNTELNPSAKGFKGALTEISSRVPRLVPTRSTLISMGAEGGSMAAGFAAGYFSAQAMNDYFAKHPAKNLGEQYGQALATTFVGMAVGSITQVVLSQVIRQGVNYALTGEIAAIEGAISGGGTLFLSSIAEAAIFTAVGVTTQMATTKFLEDAGFNHAISRSAGALASTYALANTEVGMWIAKGGPANPAGDISFLASEAMIIGFGIYSFVTEFFEGAKQDQEEEEYQAQLAENQRLNEERQRTIDSTIKRNSARQSFMLAYERADYDFDRALALLTPEQRIDLGQNAEPTDPNGLVAFRAQVEAAFDPLLDTSLPEGYVNPAPLSREDQLKRDTYTAYVSWYVDSLNGKNPPPFNFNSEGAKLLNDESGGTWTSAANVHATTSITMARRTNPLIENAQREIVDAFHKDHKTIEEMPPDIVQYADLDPSFRERYNLYIIAEAQSYIYQQYNNGGFRYDSMDPALVAIANRDPEFRGAVDFYYQTLANQARDYNLTIQECARLNALSATGQQVEIGKLNDARNKIIQEHQAANQEIVDRYNANILSQLNMYGDNFEAIIRNINDQALLTGHTFLYAATPADLYRQLHMEMPELELVDPDTDGPDAPLPGPSKGRKIGDTDLYGYRYNLTDEQNQELDELARVGVFSKDPAAMEAEAARIRYRDRYLFEDTDTEKAARENLTLDEYYKKYGITAEQPIIEWEARKGTPKEDGKYRYPDGTIVTYRNGFKVDVDLTNVVSPITLIKYDPTLSSQPDGKIEMPDGSIRTYKNGLVTEVNYPALTDPAEALTPDQINAKEQKPIPIQPGTEPTYLQLQQQYPETYKTLLRKYGDDPTGPEKIEAALRKAFAAGFIEDTTASGAAKPPVTPTEPTRQPTYDELKLMYPDELATFQAEYSRNQFNDPLMLDPLSRKFLMEQYQQNPKPLPATTPTTPIITDPAMLKQGDIIMPDGSSRTYKNGIVVFVSYPANVAASGKAKYASQINEEEGIRDSTWTPQAPVTPVEPVVDRNTLKQGRVTMPDGSTRTYIDGKVVSVQYPDGKTGPNINEINASEGVQTGTREPTYAELQVMYKTDYEYKQRTMPEFMVEAELRQLYKTDPVPIPGTVAPVAPAAAPMAAAPAPAAPEPTPAPGQTKGPKTAPEGVTEYRATKVQAQNALNQTRANDAAGISNMNNEPENP